jgi:hypothetical protein
MVCYGFAAVAIVSGYVFHQSICPWRALTHLPCPGCGMTHAFVAMAQGHFRAAWDFNPRSVVVAPILVWTGVRKIKERFE